MRILGRLISLVYHPAYNYQESYSRRSKLQYLLEFNNSKSTNSFVFKAEMGRIFLEVLTTGHGMFSDTVD